MSARCPNCGWPLAEGWNIERCDGLLLRLDECGVCPDPANRRRPLRVLVVVDCGVAA